MCTKKIQPPSRPPQLLAGMCFSFIKYVDLNHVESYQVLGMLEREDTTFLVTAASMRTFISSRVLKVKIFCTISLPRITEALGSAYGSSMGYFPILPFLHPSKNECHEWQSPLEYGQAVILCGNHIYSGEEISNLTMRIFFPSFFVITW